MYLFRILFAERFTEFGCSVQRRHNAVDGPTPRTNAARREIRGEAREKRLGTVRAFAAGEEPDGIGLFTVGCADDSTRSMHVINVPSVLVVWE
jgi:hypothetical protein